MRGHGAWLWPQRVPRGLRSPSSWGGREGHREGPTEEPPQSWGVGGSVQTDCGGLHTPRGAEPGPGVREGA